MPIIIKLQKAQDRISIANKAAHYRRQYRRKKRPKHIMLSGNYFFNPNSDPHTRRWSLGNAEDKAPLFNEYIFNYKYFLIFKIYKKILLIIKFEY